MAKTKDQTNTGTSAQTSVNRTMADPRSAPLVNRVTNMTTAALKQPQFNSQTQQGMQQINQAAGQAKPGFNAQYDRILGLNQDGGLNDLQDESVGYLQGIARGDNLHGNPYLDEIISRNTGNMTDSNAQMFSAAGRYGSAAHQGTTNKAVGDMANDLRFQNYGMERGYQQNAINDLFGAGQQQRDNVIGGTQALQDAFMAKLMPGQAKLDLGQMRSEQPWDRISNLLGVATGVGNMGSTTVNNQSGSNSYTQQGPSRLGSAIGGGLAGWKMGGPLGGVLGGLGGAFF
jgi:hypothetical protein